MSAIETEELKLALGLTQREVLNLTYLQVNQINRALKECLVPLSLIGSTDGDELGKPKNSHKPPPLDETPQLIKSTLSPFLLASILLKHNITPTAFAVPYPCVEQALHDLFIKSGTSPALFKQRMMPLIARNQHSGIVNVGLMMGLWRHWYAMMGRVIAPDQTGLPANAIPDPFHSSSCSDHNPSGKMFASTAECADWLRTNHSDDIYWFDLVDRRVLPELKGLRSVAVNNFLVQVEKAGIVLPADRWHVLEQGTLPPFKLEKKKKKKKKKKVKKRKVYILGVSRRPTHRPGRVFTPSTLVQTLLDD